MIDTEESAPLSKGTWANREAKVYGLFDISSKPLYKSFSKEGKVATTSSPQAGEKPGLQEISLSTNVAILSTNNMVKGNKNYSKVKKNQGASEKSSPPLSPAVPVYTV